MKKPEILASAQVSDGRKVDKSGQNLIGGLRMIFVGFLLNFMDFFVISEISRRSGIFKLLKKDKSLMFLCFYYYLKLHAKSIEKIRLATV